MLLAPLLLTACSGRECFVGVRGTAASITVKGTFPGGACDALIRNPVKYIGDVAADSKEFYAMSDRPAQPVVCEYTIDGEAFVVRDEGMLKVVGNILCSGLGKRADQR
jgi:hypothetical protein